MPYKDYEKQKARAREYYKNNKEKVLARMKEYSKTYSNPNRTPEEYFSVYYLPNEHYCGYTNNLRERMRHHRQAGKDVTDWRVLFCSEDELEAVVKEAKFHLILGMEGNKEVSRIKNKNYGT